MTMIVQVMKEWSAWDMLGCLFVFFFVCGCSWVGDGAKQVVDGDKKRII